MQVALVPAKPLSLAKTRLGTMLAESDRAAVAYAMFTDVLAALRDARSVARVFVVTADERLAAYARGVGAAVVDEGVPRGLNGAVVLGTDAAVAEGASAVLVVLSDVPLVGARDVDMLTARAPRPGVALVPSKEGTGTNAILRTPGGVIRPCFGGRSLERHVSAAGRSRVACTIWRNARIGFDIDVPEDLAAVAGTESATATYRETVRLGIAPLRPSV